MDTSHSAELARPASQDEARGPARGFGIERIADVLLSTDPRRRIRTTQWLITALVYLGCALVLLFGMQQGWMYAGRLIGWCAFLTAGLAVCYVALRSGWSERFADPALTAAQMVLGVIAVDWGYLICGPVRGVALFPLLLIFPFGAFSLGWRGITALTAFALTSLMASMVILHVSRSGAAAWSLRDPELRLDVTNLLMVLILLPALSLVAVRLSSLRSRLRSQRSALIEALEEVQRLATHDELTGLVNRRCMQDRLTQEQVRFQRQKLPFSIAVIDLDHFKEVNDEQGHAGGDEVLRAFASEATSMLRTTDLLARWGGEEFLLLMPGARGPQAHATVLRMLAQVRTPRAGRRPLAFSAGVTEYRAGETVAETVARADREMYAAKRSGRNTVILH